MLLNTNLIHLLCLQYEEVPEIQDAFTKCLDKIR